MAKRRITQETFDAAVRENMEEFEMDPDEALRDAVEQFESQGKWAGGWLMYSFVYWLCGDEAKPAVTCMHFQGESEWHISTSDLLTY